MSTITNSPQFLIVVNSHQQLKTTANKIKLEIGSGTIHCFEILKGNLNIQVKRRK